jgi:hypothetical protein
MDDLARRPDPRELAACKHGSSRTDPHDAEFRTGPTDQAAPTLRGPDLPELKESSYGRAPRHASRSQAGDHADGV